MRWPEASQGLTVLICLSKLASATDHGAGRKKSVFEDTRLLTKSMGVCYGLAASSASFLIVNSSRSTSVSIEEPSVPYCGSLDTSPMNSRIRFSSSIAPSLPDKVMTLLQEGQENVAGAFASARLDPAGGEKKFPSKTCPDKHSHRLNDQFPLANQSTFEFV